MQPAVKVLGCVARYLRGYAFPLLPCLLEENHEQALLASRFSIFANLLLHSCNALLCCLWCLALNLPSLA